MKLTINGS